MFRKISLATLILLAASVVRAGELDNEFGGKVANAARPRSNPAAVAAPTPGVDLAARPASSELDDESPAQACFLGGWRRGFGFGGLGFGGLGYGGFGRGFGYGGFGGLGYGGFGGLRYASYGLGYGGFGGYGLGGFGGYGLGYGGFGGYGLGGLGLGFGGYGGGWGCW